MQYNPSEIRAQQIVLAYLGFYKGPIDGVWSGDSISAKRRFECDDSFIPAAPSNGLPFAHRAKLPKGCVWDQDGLLGHRGLTVEKAGEILKNQQKQSADVGGITLQAGKAKRDVGPIGEAGPKGSLGVPGVAAEAVENAAE